MPYLTVTKLRLIVDSRPGPITIDLGNFFHASNAHHRRKEILEHLRTEKAMLDENSSPENRKGYCVFPNKVVPDFPIGGYFYFHIHTETTNFDDRRTRFFAASITDYSES